MRTHVIGALLALALAVPARAEEFKLVVNGANSVESLSRLEAAQLFLKKATRWPTGQVVQVAEPRDPSLRERFYVQVAGKSASAIRSYWNQLIFSGREVPPVEKPTDEDVLAYVRATPGAIAYVAASTATSSGVRTVRLSD